MHWAMLLGIAVISDALDYFGAAIPIVGDILDLITTAVLFPYIGLSSSIGLVELVPGADFLPTYTILALFAIWRNYKNKGHLKGLEITAKHSRPGTQSV